MDRTVNLAKHIAHCFHVAVIHEPDGWILSVFFERNCSRADPLMCVLHDIVGQTAGIPRTGPHSPSEWKSNLQSYSSHLPPLY